MKTKDFNNRIIGLMSGTSLDGLDIALCEFKEHLGTFSFKIIAAKTISYDQDWKKKLSNAQHLSAIQYFDTHTKYGRFIANETNQFLNSLSIKPNAIASHGHTVFHQPALGFTNQLGCGATIAALTGLNTVCDFRSKDVSLAGQGAPLVPIGDKLLFGEYDACLNIGGIANISYNNKNGDRIAYDLCVANMLLNYLAEKKGFLFDKGGEIAKSGLVDDLLLNQLNDLKYYKKTGAKSIGREWFEKNILNFFDTKEKEVTNLLATAIEHIATVIASELNNNKIKNVLLTGGGTFNSFLIERIKSKTNSIIVIPSVELINFKEAIIFAFLGYLRLNQITNTLKSVTGANKDSIGGAVYLG